MSKQSSERKELIQEGEKLKALRNAASQEIAQLKAKAKSDPRLLHALAGHIDGFEVASGGELRHVRGLFPDTPIAFGGPGKTPAWLRSLREAVGLEECAVIATCNRMEVYTLSLNIDASERLLPLLSAQAGVSEPLVPRPGREEDQRAPS